MFSLLRLHCQISRNSHRTTVLSWVLACALLCAQGLGIWHRVEHGFALPGLAELAYDAAEDAQAQQTEQPSAQPTAQGISDAVSLRSDASSGKHWHHLAGHAACLLLDQLLLGDLHLEAAWSVLQLEDFKQAFAHALNAGWAEAFLALFLARAPPVLR